MAALQPLGDPEQDDGESWGPANELDASVDYTEVSMPSPVTLSAHIVIDA